MEMSSLGEDLRALRTTRKMTLEDLAQKLGRSVGWLSQIERDISPPRLSDLRQIAGIFEVPLSIFFSTFQPGSSRTNRISRPTQELAYMISGKLDIWLDDDAFTVTTGDSFRIRNASYRWANPYSDPAVAGWVISPPVY